MPPDAFDRARRYLGRLNWFLPGHEKEDLIALFVMAGWEACRRKRRMDWALFRLAGSREIMQAMKHYRLQDNRAQVFVPESSGLEEFEDRSADDATEELVNRVTIEALMQKANLSAFQREMLVSFLDGRRTNLWGNGNKTPEGRRIANAVYKAIGKLREVAGMKAEEAIA